MSYIESIILGLVQGLTEFLPVSSSGHLALLQHFFGIKGEKVLIFTVLLHIGTLVSVFIMYWRDIWELIKELFLTIKDLCTGKGLRLNERPVRKLGIMIIWTTVPTVINGNYKKYAVIGAHTADLIPQNGTVITQCFADTVTGTMLRSCRESGKNVRIICAETRPYFQGSRLTASVACDMGFPVTVITDNMCAFTMKTKNVDLFTSASDVITIDGHIVNKVGTFQMALAARYYGIPYYVTGTPDSKHADLSTVTIEERDGDAVLKAWDAKITMDGVKGYYPAFDITPPELCSGVVTELGVYDPQRLADYLKDSKKK